MGRPAPPKKEVLSYPHTPSRWESREKEGEYQEKKESEFRLLLCYVPARGAFFLFFPSLLAAGQASSLFSFSHFFLSFANSYCTVASIYDTSNINSAVFSHCKRIPVLEYLHAIRSSTFAALCLPASLLALLIHTILARAPVLV